MNKHFNVILDKFTATGALGYMYQLTAIQTKPYGREFKLGLYSRKSTATTALKATCDGLTMAGASYSVTDNTN